MAAGDRAGRDPGRSPGPPRGARRRARRRAPRDRRAPPPPRPPVPSRVRAPQREGRARGAGPAAVAGGGRPDCAGRLRRRRPHDGGRGRARDPAAPPAAPRAAAAPGRPAARAHRDRSPARGLALSRLHGPEAAPPGGDHRGARLPPRLLRHPRVRPGGVRLPRLCGCAQPAAAAGPPDREGPPGAGAAGACGHQQVCRALAALPARADLRAARRRRDPAHAGGVERGGGGPPRAARGPGDQGGAVGLALDPVRRHLGRCAGGGPGAADP